MSELVVDLFAGGGGASLGLEAALGRSVDVAVNHDPIAIAAHTANHPEARHYCESVFDVDPIDATGGADVDVLWASPDCTHFSRAKGDVPKSKEIRSLAWVVTQWAKAVRPRLIFLENVPEFVSWGPLHRGGAQRGRPVKRLAGSTFLRFVRRLQGLGYEVQWRDLVACDFGAPTRRKRLFMVARCDGAPIVWPEPTHGPDLWLKPYATAAECIDWGIPCPSIFLTREQGRELGCKRPLAEKTLARIAEGIRRYVLEAGDDAYLVPGVAATMIQTGYGEREGQAPRVPHLDKPIGTLVDGQKHGVVAAHLVGAGGPVYSAKPKRVDAPYGTVLTENHSGLVSALLTKHYGGMVGTRLAEPSGTVTAKDHHAVTAAHIVKVNHGRDANRAAGADEPLSTVTAQRRGHAVTTAHLAHLRGECVGSRMEEPSPTVTAGGTHVAEVRAFLMKYYGEGGQLQGVPEPLHTLTAKARMGLVTIRGVDYQIVDIGMRMLEPHELLRCQFGELGDGYTLDVEKIVRGQRRPIAKKDKIRLIGNSVPPHVARAVVEANFGARVEAVA